MNNDGVRPEVSDLAEKLRVSEPRNEPSPALDLSMQWVTFSAADLAVDPPEKEFIWEGRIPLGDVGVFAAASGAGKTALITGLAIHRAIRKVFLERTVRHGTTVIVTAEDGKEDYKRKIAAWKVHLSDLDLEAVARHVHLLDLAGVPFKLIRSQYGDYVSTEHVDTLIDVVKAKAPDADLIVIETVSRVGGDEGNAAMSALVCAAETIAKRTGASVLLVTHVSQEAARRNIGDAQAPRGGTAIGSNGRYTITLTGVPDEAAKELLDGVTLSPQQQKELSILRVPKINSAPRQEPTVLQIVPTHWGLVLRTYDRGTTKTVEERAIDARRAIGESLRDMAKRHADLGNPVTETKLGEGGLFKDIPGLAKNGISAAVTNAVEDKLLRREVRKDYAKSHPGFSAQGGGHVLLPVLDQPREGSLEGSPPEGHRRSFNYSPT